MTDKKNNSKANATKPKPTRPKKSGGKVSVDSLGSNKKTNKKTQKNTHVASTSPKKFRPFYWLWKWAIRPLLILVIVFHLAVVGLLYVWRDSPVNNSAFMITHRLTGGTVRQTWVDYKDIAKSAKQAAIASEDAKFATHNGFDLTGIEAAMKSNEKSGTVSAGGSTISQQLAKNLFLTSHRSYIRKGEEAIITIVMEKMWDKKRILEVYLNVAEFGEGIYGVEAAAQHYFKRSASKLNREQSALLIAMLPNPKFYGKNLDNRRLKNKQRIIINRMNGAVLPK